MGVRWYGRGAYERGVETTDTIKAKRLFRAHSGDFVFNRIDTQKGAFDVVPEHLDGALTTNEFPLYGAISTEVLARFVLLHFQQPKVLEAIANTRAGSEGRARWKEGDFEAQVLFVPPLREQRRIVDFMAAVDALIEALAAERRSAARVLDAARSELGASEHRVPLAWLAADGGIQIGPFGSQLHAHEYTDAEDGIPVVMPQDLIDGEIVTTKIKRVPRETAARLSRHRLFPGDVVFPRRGDLSKRALVQDHQAGWLCGTGCLRFRPLHNEDANRLFEALAADATSEWLTEHAVGTTMLNLNTEILSKLPVPSIEEYGTLADACTAISAGGRSLRDEADALGALRRSLLTVLLSGEVTIPDSYDDLLEVAS